MEEPATSAIGNSVKVKLALTIGDVKAAKKILQDEENHPGPWSLCLLPWRETLL